MKCVVMFKKPLTQLPQVQAMAICISGCLLAANALKSHTPWAAAAALAGVGFNVVQIGREPDKDEVDELINK